MASQVGCAPYSCVLLPIQQVTKQKETLCTCPATAATAQASTKGEDKAHLLEVLSVVPVIHIKEVWADASLSASAAGSGAAVAPAAGSAPPVGTRAALASPAQSKPTLQSLRGPTDNVYGKHVFSLKNPF